MSSSEVLISKEALLYNHCQFRRIAGRGSAIMHVVKSEAYGHGMELAAKALSGVADWFGTVSLEEALRLRQAGVKNPIAVLSFYDPGDVEEAIRNEISLVVYDELQARALDKAAKRLGLKALVHLKIDTGTSRLGVLAHDFQRFAARVASFKNLEIQGLLSHFSSSEEDVDYTKQQLRLFDQATQELAKLSIRPKLKHIACTAAILELPDSMENLVRLGIGTYGLWPSMLAKRNAGKIHPSLRLKPALTWKTRVIQVKILPKGAYVGYGKTFMTKRPTTLAVLPVGYFDGYDRKLSNQGTVLIKGRRCPVLGRICMNLTMVDATSIKNIRAGDEVVLIGRQGRQQITAEEIAQLIGTINYEVVTRINPLIPRKLCK